MKLRPRILTFRRRHLLLAVIAIVYIWLATAGTWDLFGPEQFGSFYDYQALAFRHGRLNVPPESIGYEAFLYQGKTYGYWGPFPALLRLPLAIFGRGPWVGHLSRISCLAAALVSLAAVCGLFRELRQRLTPGAPTRDGGWFEDVCLAGLALGTTTLFLIARPYVYHEVILWASALALLALDWGLRYERERKYIWLLAAALAGAGAALTRPTIGYGALLGTTLLWAVSLARDARTSGRGLSSVIASVRSRRHVAFALVILFGLLAPLVYNFLRFDEFSPPYRLHILYTPERLARTNGGHLFQPANFGPTLRAYLNPTQGEWRAQFPYFFTTYFSPEHPGRPVLDYSEPVAGLLATDIGLAVLAVIGVVRLARDPPLLALGAGTLATIYLTSIYACITERYLHDFLPALALTAISGAAVLIHRTGRAAALCAWRRDCTRRYIDRAIFRDLPAIPTRRHPPHARSDPPRLRRILPAHRLRRAGPARPRFPTPLASRGRRQLERCPPAARRTDRRENQSRRHDLVRRPALAETLGRLRQYI